MRKSLFYCVAVAVAFAPGLWAQEQGGAAPGGNTGGQQPSSPGGQQGQSPAGQQPSGRGQQQQQDPFGNQQQRQMERRPVFLSGKVVLEDGTAPPEPAVIERVCNGQVHPEAYTDSRGNFSFELGGDQTLAMTDASVSGSRGPGTPFGGNDPFSGGGDFGGGGGAMGQVNLTGCDIRVQLSGYRSDSVSLGRRSVFDNPNVGTIILHRLDGVEGTAVSATSLAAPKEARKAYENGIKEMRKKKSNPEKAQQEFEKAVAAYPQYASAWSALGQLRLAQENTEGAQEAFEKALEADSKYLNPYQPLVRMHLVAKRWEPAADLAGQALRLNPHMTDMQYFIAVANLNEGNLEEAEKAAQAVQQSKDAKDFPQTHQILGLIQAEKGNFDGAAQEYRTYLAVQSAGPVAEDLKRRLNEWEALGVIKKAPAGPAEAINAVKE
ncbi:MAG: tetratricopeptide repeat protein [Bryobacterales bacterium]